MDRRRLSASRFARRPTRPYRKEIFVHADPAVDLLQPDTSRYEPDAFHPSISRQEIAVTILLSGPHLTPRRRHFEHNLPISLARFPSNRFDLRQQSRDMNRLHPYVGPLQPTRRRYFQRWQARMFVALRSRVRLHEPIRDSKPRRTIRAARDRLD